MSKDSTTQALDRLVEVRERDVQRLTIDMARKTETRDRYTRNLSRLQQLSEGAGGSSVAPPKDVVFTAALSLNCGRYKQSLMSAMDAHRVDLSLHESDMSVTQRALLEAARRHEALDLALRQRLERVRLAQQRRARKQEDETASQMWCRVHK